MRPDLIESFIFFIIFIIIKGTKFSVTFWPKVDRGSSGIRGFPNGVLSPGSLLVPCCGPIGNLSRFGFGRKNPFLIKN